jgi:hypothetical protein
MLNFDFFKIERFDTFFLESEKRNSQREMAKNFKID